MRRVSATLTLLLLSSVGCQRGAAPSSVSPTENASVDDTPSGDAEPASVSWTGRVAEVSGRTDVEIASPCVVRITSVPENAADYLNCRVEVSCGDVVLYGGGYVGFNHCPSIADDTHVSDLHDDDEDPKLELDLLAGSVRVDQSASETVPAWSVLLLDEQGRRARQKP